MFVSLSAALVQACGFGEKREVDSVVALQADGNGRETGQKRGGEEDVFQPEETINRHEVKSSWQGTEVHIN